MTISISSILFPLAALSATCSTLPTVLLVTSKPILPSVSRIVGGKQSGPGEFPYFVDMGGCGGALIAPDAVLFAAHCDTRKNQQVIVGSYERGSLEYKESDSSETYKAEARFCETWVAHPQYNNETLNNDFALCRLNDAVVQEVDTTDTKTTTTTTLLELNFDAAVPRAGEDLIVLGTGTLAEDGVRSTLLRDVTVPAMSNAECNTMYGGGGNSGIITANMLCAGLKQGGKDSCQGDSGGPIVKRVLRQQNDGTNNGKTQYIDYHVGIVSFGVGCARANRPGVYARTSAAKEWIQGTLRAWNEGGPYAAECNSGIGSTSGSDSDGDSVEIDVSVTTDTYGSETGVTIREKKLGSNENNNNDDDDTNNTLYFVRNYLASNNVNDHTVCLPKNKCYTFEILDTYGDGLCFDNNICGNYKATYRGTQMFASDNFKGASEQNTFCIDRNGEEVNEKTLNRRQRTKRMKNTKNAKSPKQKPTTVTRV